MSIEQKFGNFFKSEIKASGRKLVAEEKVSLASASDSTIQAYVRASPPIKVHFRSAGVGAPAFIADCSCPTGKKSQFCKHVWAALILVDEKNPDFLGAKRMIDKPEAESDDAPAADDYAATAKRRAAEYRKEQYEKQKARAKGQKHAERTRESAREVATRYPEAVTSALAYFTLNGFPMEDGPSGASIAEAKRKLSRVLHPDKGGSHSEMTELNQNCEILERFLGL